MLTASNRQREILKLAGKGLSYQEIGDQLGVKAGTVKTQLHRVNKKLGAKNTTHAVALTLGEYYRELLSAFFHDAKDGAHADTTRL